MTDQVEPSFAPSADDPEVLLAAGPWVAATVSAIDPDLRAMNFGAHGRFTIHLGGVTELDTSGAWLLHRTRKEMERQKSRVEFASVNDDQMILLEEIASAGDLVPEEPVRQSGLFATIGRLGIQVEAAWESFAGIVAFLGLTMVVFGRTVRNPGRLRFTSMVFHMEQAGVSAVPIVALLSFLVGGVLAYQGSVQLRNFGAELFTVELIAISVLREIGMLLTAIIVAGRSGSAYTAEIGSMKVHEEIDAMQTLALDPIELLVVPRMLALVLMMPLLGFISDLAGLFGGAVVSYVSLGISPSMFVARLAEMVAIEHFWVGLVKAPFFAAIIALVGCYEGMRVEGSAESVGQHTTQSVVESIFIVIIADALFSIFFVQIGV